MLGKAKPSRAHHLPGSGGAAFLEQRGESLQKAAVEIILQAASTRALSQVLGARGTKVAELGAGEVVEGIVRGAAAQALAERSEELAGASAGLAARGLTVRTGSPDRAAGPG